MGKAVRSWIGIALLASLLAVWSTPAAAQGIKIQHYGPTWRGEYFNNISLSGYPLLVRGDPAIDFDWGLGAPAPGLPADRFSVRWTRTLDLGAGDYTFSATADDGVRLWVDGRLLVDQWHDHAATTYTAHLFLSEGYHVIQMEYYENLERATAKLSWGISPPPPPPTLLPPPPPPPYPGAWQGEYFNNRYLQGPPAMVRADPNINFDWGHSSPGPGLGVDDFSVRWTRTVFSPEGNYRFQTMTDDGVRLRVDDRTIIDQWHDQAATAYTADIYLSRGSHTLVMEYYEHGDRAMAQLSWWQLGPAPTPVCTPTPVCAPRPIPAPCVVWRGEYFNNPYLSGPPVFTRLDKGINFNWGWGGPRPCMPHDNFSVRWISEINFRAGGQYVFYARTDDGVRLWVDGRLIIDLWYDHDANMTYSGSIYLNPGRHQVKVEYYEHCYWAEARVWGRWCGECRGMPCTIGDVAPGFKWPNSCPFNWNDPRK